MTTRPYPLSFLLLIIISSSCSFEFTKEELESLVPPPCPCSNPSFCNPVKVGPRKEFFVFHMPGGDQDDTWKAYDYKKLTTIVNFSWFPKHTMEMVCLAHSNNVRVYPSLGGFDVDQWGNVTARHQFIYREVKNVVDNFYDGINIDYESALYGENATLLTTLTTEVNEAFKIVNPWYQVTYDVAWSPDCIDGRCYDYPALSKVTDLFFVMAYDMRSQIFDACVASANTPSAMARHGMKRFMEIGIPNDKLVLGLPWYGYDYPCLQTNNATVITCPIKQIPFRGVACSDSAGRQRTFDDIMDNALPKASTGRKWDSLLESPWFNYVDDKRVVHQVWYDDPQSLGIKVGWAKQMNLRGVGVWEVDYVSQKNQKRHREMWSTFTKFFS
eukprot:TRINITY_DN1903_c2_g1_i1.p1 TRINITY_DN1903_c2_g1~~TRINITY_DN1903_c2_g1_i1.p1  ORF type:complete len:398 (-),score=92.00 TRINITY_DN1903_c2_g1_i1:44-1198(-)